MSYLVASAIVVASVLLSAVASFLVRRRVTLETLRRHHEVGSYVFLQMGVVFAVLLAFVFTEVWNEYNSAASAISAERTSLVSAARLARGLPDASAKDVGEAITGYIESVIRKEWPAMATGRHSAAAEAALDRLWARARSVAAGGGRDAALGGQILVNLTDAGKARGTRVFQMANGVPPVLWVLLILFSLVLVGFLLFFGVEYMWSQAFFTGAFAGSLAFVLVLIALLDYPFSGALRLSPEPFEHALTQITQGDAAR
jgi:hydrogenase maturation factor